MSKETNSGTPPVAEMLRGGGSADFIGEHPSSAVAPFEKLIDPALLRRTGQFAATGCRRGAPWWRHLLVLAGLVCVAAILLQVIGDVRIWAVHRLEVLVTIAGIACWRWSWFVLQNVRAMIYR